VFSRNDRSKLLLCSSASLCLIVAGLSAPGASFAEATIPSAAALTAGLASPLGSLKEAQDIYSKEFGMVSAMPGGSLAPQEKAAKALQEIRGKILQIRNSGNVTGDLLKDTLIAIDEAQTALLTDSAQTIAYSLGTVGEEIKAIEAKLKPENAPQTASSEPAKQEPQQQGAEAKPEQAQPQQVAANEPKPQANLQQAQAPQAQPQTDQNKPAGAGQPSNEPAGKPSTAEATPLSPDQLASIANKQRNDLVGKMLYDNAGNEVGKIQDVKTTGDGKIAAAEIDVGGFLGIGSRRIPVAADQLQMKGDRVVAKSLTAEQIKSLPHEGR
jgi:hypothetical protein